MATGNSEKGYAVIKSNLDADGRHYVFDSGVADSYTKDFRMVANDLRLLRFAEDVIGAISDMHILYAVAVMGVADYTGVQRFLRNWKVREKDLAISGTDDPSGIRNRLRALFQLGLLFKHMYRVPIYSDSGTPEVDEVTLYTVTPTAVAMINNKLNSHVNGQEWVQMRPLYDLEGWAASSAVANMVDSYPNCIERKQGAFKTPFLGSTTLIPGILKLQGSEKENIFVGFVPAFLHMNSAAQTQEQFQRDVEYRINVMRQFLFSQDKKEHVARLVVVVEDSTDLSVVVNYILKSDELKGDYYRIFFTGEGALMRSSDKDKLGRDCFLGIKESKTKSGFSYYAATPDFLPK